MILRTLLTLTATVATSLVLAAPAYATPPNPTATGSHAVTVTEYDAGWTTLTDPTDHVTYQERLRGVLYVPSGIGPFPVLVFLHGQHLTCDTRLVSTTTPSCPDTAVSEDIPSYRGYGYLGSNLASNGYLVMSLYANDVNAFNLAGDYGAQERAELVAKSLDLLHDWNLTPAPDAVGSLLVGKADLDRIGLMGHSRGGEGVDQFVTYNRTRTDGRRYPGLRAVFALAPTVGTVPPYGVHWATLLPLCDGDVSDLQGAQVYDSGRYADPNETHVRAQYTVVGANHDWFNTIWTGDDYGGSDPACDTGNPANVRLSAAQQRAVGLALIGAFLRRWVGGEATFDAFVKGEAALPVAGTVKTSYLAPARDRLGLARPGTATVTAAGFATYAACMPGTDGTGCPTDPTRGLADQYTLAWTGPATFTATIPPTDVSGLDALTFRTGVNYDDPRNTTAAQHVAVTLTDTAGHAATIDAAAYTQSLTAPPGTDDREVTLDGVWLPLSAFAGVDLAHVTTVTLGFGTLTPSGSIQLCDLAFQD